MRPGFKSLRFNSFLIISFIFFGLLPSSSSAQFYRLAVKPGDTVTHAAGELNRELSIYMINWEDTVAAFVITLTTSHPDVIDFQVGSYDISGTLISNWEYVSTSGSSAELKISAMANTIPPPYTPGIGYPQYSEYPLVKVLYDINELPDTMTTQTVKVYIKDNIQQFNFSDELGNTIGLGYGDTTYDTSWYDCIEWIEDECMAWEEVPGPPADTMVVDTILHPYLDTTLVRIWDGSIDIISCSAMGDANGDANVNIFDVTYLIAYLYLDGPAPPSWAHPDVNCDCVINIFDVTCLITYLYQVGWPCEPCTCEQWEANCGK